MEILVARIPGIRNANSLNFVLGVALISILGVLFCLDFYSGFLFYYSIGSILSCRAEILQLDVTDIKMDGHLAE